MLEDVVYSFAISKGGQPWRDCWSVFMPHLYYGQVEYVPAKGYTSIILSLTPGGMYEYDPVDNQLIGSIRSPNVYVRFSCKGWIRDHTVLMQEPFFRGKHLMLAVVNDKNPMKIYMHNGLSDIDVMLDWSWDIITFPSENVEYGGKVVSIDEAVKKLIGSMPKKILEEIRKAVGEMI